MFAGAAVGVESPSFEKWHDTFWDNLATSIQLHKVHRIIAIDHRDCGAAKIAFGEDAISTLAKETAVHNTVMAQFRDEVAKRRPGLAVEGYLMALNGRAEKLV